MFRSDSWALDCLCRQARVIRIEQLAGEVEDARGRTWMGLKSLHGFEIGKAK